MAFSAGSTTSADGAVGAQCRESFGRSLVLISARTGAVERSFPRGDRAFVVLADGRGGWFASGTFGCPNKKPVAHVVHLRPDGSVDSAWRPAHPATVLALAGRTLYGGGYRVEALDAATGAQRWLAHVNGRQGVSPSQQTRAPSTWAATSQGSTTRHALRWLRLIRAPAGYLLRPPTLRGGPPGVTVQALALAGRRLYVGASPLTSIGGQKRRGLAALDARSGRLTPWIPATADGYRPGSGVGDVETILVTHGQVLTAGHDGFGVTDARSGEIKPWMYDLHGVGYRFAAFDNTVYLAGGCRNSFDSVAGLPRNNLAAINLRTGKFAA